MDKGLTVPKWVLINRPKIPQMPQNLSAQNVCPSPKVTDFDEKRLHWASVVHGAKDKNASPERNFFHCDMYCIIFCWYALMKNPVGIPKQMWNE